MSELKYNEFVDWFDTTFSSGGEADGSLSGSLNWLKNVVTELESTETEKLGTKLSLEFALAAQSFSSSEVRPNSDRFAGWSQLELARLALLLKVSELDPLNFETHMDELFDRGDDREKITILRSLAFFPRKPELLDIALKGTRTNSSEVFTALCKNNPFPDQVFSEPQFNQMVLKALFMDLGIDEVLGLKQRINKELVRSVSDYKRELEIAGRKLKPGIEAILRLAESH